MKKFWGVWGTIWMGLSAGAWAVTPADLAQPFQSLNRSSAPLALAEGLLQVQEFEPVRAYRERLIETGRSDLANRVRCLEELYAANTAGALQAIELLERKDPWAQAQQVFLTRLLEIQANFTSTKSEHFVVRTSAEDAFLGPYVVPVLEAAYGKTAGSLGSAPARPVVVEIYPTLESYGFAAGLTREGVEKTGFVAVHRWGRIVALSPGATAFGYRWMDALVQAYATVNILRLSGGLSPAWVREGSAKFLEGSWRRSDGFKPSPWERAQLTRAALAEPSGLLGLERWDRSHSWESQRQGQLAVSEAADAVDFMVQDFGEDKWRALLKEFRSWARPEAFQSAIGVSELDFEKSWRESLSGLTEVPTDLARGSVGRVIWFGAVEEGVLVQAGVRDVLERGDRLAREGKSAAAVSEYKKAVEMEPDNGVALGRLAGAHIEAEKYSSAEELLKRATEKNPDYVTPFVRLGELYFDDGRYEECQAVLQQALEIQPFHAKVHEVLGLMAVDVGNFALARQSLRLALRFDPSNKTVAESLRRMPKNR